MFDESTVWDTGCARKILQIPEDQLFVLNNIPEWCSQSSDSAAKPTSSSVQLEINSTEKETRVVSNSPKLSGSNSNNTNRPNKNSKCRSLKSRNYSSEKIKPQCLTKTTNQRLKRSLSASDICKSEPIKLLSACRSEESLKIYQFVMSRESTDLVRSKKPLNEMSNLISGKSDKGIENSGENVFSNEYFKGLASQTEVLRSSSEKPKDDSDINNILLNKRLELLEKRFSPLKLPASTDVTDDMGKLAKLKVILPSSEFLKQESCKSKDNATEHNSVTSLSNSYNLSGASASCGQPVSENKLSPPKKFSNKIPDSNKTFEQVQEKVLIKKTAGHRVDTDSLSVQKLPNRDRVNEKRKRKSKSDKPSKKQSNLKDCTAVDITFSEDQIGNMINLMKVFQSF